ncbi:Nif11 family protein [Nostoc sp. FACHB-87]|uniref:Nif11-like leader peptide family natural product precursor n=1 Tax=Nostocaceae TaxID=1162 RepID=UPI00168506A4|nr:MULTISPECIES: Nif11-like leader peptide family natural product precursor [Nostocaceae]MBD2458829.1 Nif11 family protein [Nostoc sp. FACHB-87]MBD2479866.1 Nif11 family protein [Anabaena sp. FACHB-83]
MSESLNAAQSELQVMEFFAAALQDKVLLNQLMEAMGVKDNAAIIAMAAEYGYNFSQESLHQGLTKVFHLITPIMQEQNLAVSEE